MAERMYGVTWGKFYANFRIRPDTELTDEDVATSNLVLFGGPRSNAYARKIAGGLPVKLDGGKLVFRGKTCGGPGAAVRFICPNPANPKRYVVVHCGVTSEALRNIRGSILGEPDWVLFDDASTKRREEGKTPGYAEAGFFDQDWK